VVDRVENKGVGDTRAAIKITRVYSGPQALKGTVFVDQTADEGDAGSLAIPLFKVGEVGLWILGTDENSGGHVVSGRYRKCHWPKYDLKVEWAEAVERLVKLKISERLIAAKDLCAHQSPELAQLGVEVLFGAYEPDAEKAGVPKFIAGLPTNRAVSHSTLVRADQLAVSRYGKKWITCDERKVLLDRFTEVLTDADAGVVTHYLASPSRFKFETLPLAEAAALLGKIACNPRQPDAVRSTAVERVIHRANTHSLPDFAFDTLVKVVRNDADDATRLLAANGFVTLARRPMPPKFPQGSYSATQLGTLRGLLKDEQNAAVTKALRTAIERSE
jgi:hypothetical protein